MHASSSLLGHDAAMRTFEAALAVDRMPHAWLLTGPRGIGKAALAREFAARLIAPDAAARQRFEAGSHGDFLVLRPDEEAGKAEIPVDDARSALEFVILTPSESEWRVVLVDPAEALNTNAANALLKTLEEPPPRAVLLLVSHQPGALLPTIRSRCRKLALHVPDAATTAQILATAAPEIPAADHAALLVLGDGAPGEAIRLYQAEGLSFYRDLLEVLSPQAKATARLAFIERITAKGKETEWRLFERLLPLALARAARLEVAEPADAVYTDEIGHLYALVNSRARYETAVNLLAEARALNLNTRTVALDLIDG